MKVLLFATYLCTVPLMLGSDGLRPPQPSDPTKDLLGGRLTIRLPGSVQTTGVWSDIMGPAPADTEISRIQLDAGPQRMVILAYELFARAGNNFEDVVRAKEAAAPTKMRVEEWKGQSPLRGYVSFPETAQQNDEGSLVMSLYVAPPDGTVQHLVFLANQIVAQDPQGAIRLATSIANTLAVGRRTLNTTAGEYPLFSSSKETMAIAMTTHSTPAANGPQPGNSVETIFVTLPDGFVTTEEVGIDFSINRIRKVTMFGELTPGILVYVGDHPSRIEGVTQDAAILLGKETHWYEKTITAKDGKSSLRDTANVTPSWHSASQVQVSLQARDKSEMDELKRIARTLIIKPR
jgi:hypothetical protein